MHKSAEVKSNDCTSADYYLLDNFRNDQKNNRSKAGAHRIVNHIIRLG